MLTEQLLEQKTMNASMCISKGMRALLYALGQVNACIVLCCMRCQGCGFSAVSIKFGSSFCRTTSSAMVLFFTLYRDLRYTAPGAGCFGALRVADLALEVAYKVSRDKSLGQVMGSQQ